MAPHTRRNGGEWARLWLALRGLCARTSLVFARAVASSQSLSIFEPLKTPILSAKDKSYDVNYCIRSFLLQSSLVNPCFG